MFTRKQFLQLFVTNDVGSLNEQEVAEIFTEEGIASIVALCNKHDLEPSKSWNTEEPKAHMPLGVALIDLSYVLSDGQPYDPSHEPKCITDRQDLAGMGRAWVYELQAVNDRPHKVIEIQVVRGAPSLNIL
jgi:hypothetical protein